MKYIKQYELTTEDIMPEIGDYVYCELTNNDYEPNKFIGKLIENKNDRQKKRYPYKVKYEDQKRLVRIEEIKAFAKTKKELDIYINSIKYNL